MTATELWRHGSPEATQMWKFLQHVNAKYNLTLKDYPELYKWSVDNVAEFWGDVCKQQSELFIPLSGCLGSLSAPETATLLPTYSRNTPIGNNTTDIVGRALCWNQGFEALRLRMLPPANP
jgi:hypothetical protein